MNERYSVHEDVIDEAVDHVVNTQGLGYGDARHKVNDEPPLQDSDATTFSYHAPGRATSYPKSGHVRDFQSVPDDERIFSLARPQTQEAWEALEKALPYLAIEHDAQALRRIQAEYLREDRPITYHEARARVYAYYKDVLEPEAILGIFEEYFGDGVYRASAKPIIVE